MSAVYLGERDTRRAHVCIAFSEHSMYLQTRDTSGRLWGVESGSVSTWNSRNTLRSFSLRVSWGVSGSGGGVGCESNRRNRGDRRACRNLNSAIRGVGNRQESGLRQQQRSRTV